jgi:exosortase
MSEPTTLPQVGIAGTGPAAAGAALAAWTDRTCCGLTGRVWARIAIIAGLMIALFWPILLELLRKTNPFREHQNWGHAIFVPLIGLYYLYLNRQELLAAASAPQRRRGRPGVWPALAAWLLLQAALCGLVFVAFAYFRLWFHYNSGLVLLGLVLFSLSTGLLALASQRGREFFGKIAEHSASWFGCYMMLWGIWFYSFGIAPGRNHFFQGFAIIFTLFGVVLLQCGWRVMRIAWFPIAFLAFALPWPELLYTRVAVPLQFLSSEAATFTLQLTGIEAVRKGTTIFIPVPGDKPLTLNVAEACAGIKSLMTFMSVAAAVGFLSARPMWQKIAVAASGLPIAILCNMFRVAGQGLLHRYVSPKLSEGFAHMFVGMVMLIPAFFMVLGVAWIIDRLFIEEEEDELAAAAPRNDKVIEVRRPSRAGAAPAAPTPAAGDLSAATQRLMRSSLRRDREEGRS